MQILHNSACIHDCRGLCTQVEGLGQTDRDAGRQRVAAAAVVVTATSRAAAAAAATAVIATSLP